MCILLGMWTNYFIIAQSCSNLYRINTKLSPTQRNRDLDGAKRKSDREILDLKKSTDNETKRRAQLEFEINQLKAKGICSQIISIGFLQ